MEKYVKPASKRKPRRLTRSSSTTPSSRSSGATIAKPTTYRVSVDREEFIAKVSRRSRPPRGRAAANPGNQGWGQDPSRWNEGRGTGQRSVGGAEGKLRPARHHHRTAGSDFADPQDDRRHPDRQRATEEFIGNPNDFIPMVKRRLAKRTGEIVVEGIQYEQIGGYVYELRELQRDGLEEKDRFIDQMYKLQHPAKYRLRLCCSTPSRSASSPSCSTAETTSSCS